MIGQFDLVYIRAMNGRVCSCLVTCLLACVDPPSGARTEASKGAPSKVETKPAMAAEPGFEGEPLSSSTLAGGLLIEEFVIGEGEEARVGSEVSVHYTGTLDDGSVFDSSRKRNKPYEFTIGEGGVIKGWDLGVPGMKVGGKRRLTIPAELAYGKRKKGKIPANSQLTFTLELVASYPPLPPGKGDEAFAGEPLEKRELEGGLMIEEFAIGDGRVAQADDKVLVHYTGKLDDGTVFDSSLTRKKPIGFVLGTGRVIKGWDLGIAGMKVGGLRRLVIPAALAYGSRAKGKIPADARLTFTVELMAVRDAPPMPTRPRLDSPALPSNK